MLTVIRSLSSLSHDGAPDVVAICADKGVAYRYVEENYPDAKRQKVKGVEQDAWDIDKYDEVYFEEWSILT